MDEWMDGTDGRTDARTDGWMDARTDGRTDGWKGRRTESRKIPLDQRSKRINGIPQKRNMTILYQSLTDQTLSVYYQDGDMNDM